MYLLRKLIKFRISSSFSPLFLNLACNNFSPTHQFLLLFNWFDYSPLEYDGKPFPVWADAAGWVMAFIPIIIITSMAVWRFVRTPALASSQQDRTFIQVRTLI